MIDNNVDRMSVNNSFRFFRSRIVKEDQSMDKDLHLQPDQPVLRSLICHGGQEPGISCVCSLRTDRPGFFSRCFLSDKVTKFLLISYRKSGEKTRLIGINN